MTRKEREAAALEEIMWEMTKPHTLEAIAERLGCSFQLVSEIEKRAIRKMGKVLRRKRIRSVSDF